MTDESQFDQIERPEDGDNDGSDPADLSRLEEPVDAARLSPYSIAAFAVSLVALWLVPQSSFVFFGGFGWESLFSAAVPAFTAAVALWLTARAEEEIYIAEGRLGGVGFCRAARVVAIVSLVSLAVALIFPHIDELPSLRG